MGLRRVLRAGLEIVGCALPLFFAPIALALWFWIESGSAFWGYVTAFAGGLWCSLFWGPALNLLADKWRWGRTGTVDLLLVNAWPLSWFMIVPLAIVVWAASETGGWAYAAVFVVAACAGCAGIFIAQGDA